jgi:hypothetical protein
MKLIKLSATILLFFFISCSDQEYDDVIDPGVQETKTHLSTELENEETEIINFFDFNYAKSINKNLRLQYIDKNFDQEIVDSLRHNLYRQHLSDPFLEELIYNAGFPIWDNTFIIHKDDKEYIETYAFTPYVNKSDNFCAGFMFSYFNSFNAGVDFQFIDRDQVLEFIIDGVQFLNDNPSVYLTAQFDNELFQYSDPLLNKNAGKLVAREELNKNVELTDANVEVCQCWRDIAFRSDSEVSNKNNDCEHGYSWFCLNIVANVSYQCTGGSHGGDGGSNTGGSDTGGPNTGGPNTGGPNTGGPNTGGPNTGGGTNTGGTNTGGGTNSGNPGPGTLGNLISDCQDCTGMPNIDPNEIELFNQLNILHAEYSFDNETYDYLRNNLIAIDQPYSIYSNHTGSDEELAQKYYEAACKLLDIEILGEQIAVLVALHGPNAPQAEQWSESKIALQAYWNAISGRLHTVFDVLGLVPGFGEAFDFANALIYTIEGDGLNASLSLAATIPFAGTGATVTKFYSKVGGIGFTWKTASDGTIKFAGGKSKLRKVLGLGSTSSDPRIAHHIIPDNDAIKELEIIQDAASTGKFHIHMFENGIPLDPVQHGTGFNLAHQQYNNNFLAWLKRQFDEGTYETGDDAVMLLLDQANKVRTQLENGTALDRIIF